MAPFPILKTDGLLLRQFQLSDAAVVQRLAGVKEVAKGTLLLPHPYGDGDGDGLAEQWITSQQRDFKAGTLVNVAIVLAKDDLLIGSIGLEIAAPHQHARMGYWLGLRYWNHGYGTEAVMAVLA